MNQSQGDEATESGDLDERVGRLETDVAESKPDPKTVLADLAYLKGGANLTPTMMQLIGFAPAVFGAAGSLFVK